jgi:hypothetical protein
VIFIEIYSQIRVFSEFGSKKRAKTISRDTIAIQKKEKPIILFDSATLWFSLYPY